MAQNMAALIRQIGARQGLTPAQIRMMLATARVESGLRADAVGDGGHSFGLFQHNRFGAGGQNAERFRDPVVSIRERARWFKERNITTPEGAYALQRPADRASYIRKLTAALGGGGAELNAPIGLGAEMPGLPSADDPVAARLAGLGAARAGLAGEDPDTDAARAGGLRERTASLRAARMAAMPEPAGGGHDGHAHAPSAPGAAPGMSGQEIAAWAAKNFGLKATSINRPGAITASGNVSNHAKGRAVDFGDAPNSPAQLRAIAAWARKNAPRIRELYFDPLGWYIKNGKIIKGSIGGHSDHVHIAM